MSTPMAMGTFMFPLLRNMPLDRNNNCMTGTVRLHTRKYFDDNAATSGDPPNLTGHHEWMLTQKAEISKPKDRHTVMA